jgi:hypothetical protein
MVNKKVLGRRLWVRIPDLQRVGTIPSIEMRVFTLRWLEVRVIQI